jgi:hypothetical protein
MLGRPKRPWFQFSLKAILGVMTLIGVGLGWLSYERNQVRQRKAAIAAMEEVGGRVDYDEAKPFRSAWLSPLLGLPSSGEVVGVTVVGKDITDARMAHLEEFTNLEYLFLDSNNVTDKGLVHLRGLAKLKSLGLSQTEITDAGLVRIAGLTQLEDLTLDGTAITDAGMVHLAHLTNLKTLSLNFTSVTDKGLPHLAGLTNLEFLGLGDTQVTDSGLVHLGRLKNLEELLLPAKVTHEGMSELKKKLPKLGTSSSATAE